MTALLITKEGFKKTIEVQEGMYVVRIPLHIDIQVIASNVDIPIGQDDKYMEFELVDMNKALGYAVYLERRRAFTDVLDKNKDVFDRLKDK